MIYVDGTIASSELAGILVLVGVMWALWASTWLARIEVHALAAPLVNRLGLRWAREGISARVLATGEGPDGRPVQLKFGRGEEPGTLLIWRRAVAREPWQAVGADEL